MKLKIALSSIIIFFLGTAQAYLIAKFVPVETAADFFYLQSFILFSVTVGSSTIVIKNYSKVETHERYFNLLFPLFQILVTLLLILIAAAYLLVATETMKGVIAVVVLSTLLNANTSVTSFLRLYERSFIRVQWLRVGMLCMKITLMGSLPLGEISLTQLLLIFLIADSITIVLLFLLLQGLRDEFHYIYDPKGAEHAALVWGNFNAMLRNLPRLLVFFIAERFYAAQAIVDLRILLLARENLASMMGLINLVFFKEIFSRHKFLIFALMLITGMLFQVGFIWGVSFAGLSITITGEVLLFYLSASAVYGVVQQHWTMVKNNREQIQFLITFTAILVMAACVAISVIAPLNLNPISYLTIFNTAWVAFIAFVRNPLSADDVKCR